MIKVGKINSFFTKYLILTCSAVPVAPPREFYYWDSYWTIEGLLLSEMVDTVRGMLENFVLVGGDWGGRGMLVRCWSCSSLMGLSQISESYRRL